MQYRPHPIAQPSLGAVKSNIPGSLSQHTTYILQGPRICGIQIWRHLGLVHAGIDQLAYGSCALLGVEMASGSCEAGSGGNQTLLPTRFSTAVAAHLPDVQSHGRS